MPQPNDEIFNQARTIIAEKLIADGFTPGKDFSSSADKGFMVSDRVKEVIFSSMPPEVRAQERLSLKGHSTKRMTDKFQKKT